MPTDAVWIVVTVPRKDHELELKLAQKSSKHIRYEGKNSQKLISFNYFLI